MKNPTQALLTYIIRAVIKSVCKDREQAQLMLSNSITCPTYKNFCHFDHFNLKGGQNNSTT